MAARMLCFLPRTKASHTAVTKSHIFTAPKTWCGRVKALSCLGHGQLSSQPRSPHKGKQMLGDNGVENNMCLRNFMQIKINKMYPNWWASLLCFRLLWTFWKAFWLFCRNSILHFDFLPYALDFYISTCHILKEPSLATTENITMNEPRFQKRHL